MDKQSLIRAFLILCLSLPIGVKMKAQDDNEFQRIAKRVMDSYEASDDVEMVADSGYLYGGAYLGASSKGRSMPSAYVTYRVKDRYLITANLAFDLGETVTSRDIDNQFVAGGYLNTGTNFLTNIEKTDISVRLDYRTNPNGIFTFGLLETYDRQKVKENSIKSGEDAAGQHTESVYEEQQRDAKNLKYGSLIQYIQTFRHVGRLTTRLNLRYNSVPTSINDDIWSASSAKASRYQMQELKNFDPYGMIEFQTKTWNGFGFGVTEKYVLENMSIQDSDTKFNYDCTSSLTTLKFKYSRKKLSFDGSVTYEQFQHEISDHVSAAIESVEHDWMASGSVSAKLSPKHSLKFSYDRDIKRPTYTQLYPFVHIGSGIGAKVVGNPNLQPSQTQQFKLMHSLKGETLTLNTGLSYKHIDNEITNISTFDELTQTSVKTWVNDATYDNYKFTTEGRFKRHRWDITAGFHAQYIDYSGSNVTGDKTWSYSFKVRPQVSLPKDWMLATSWVFTGREVHRTYYNRSNLYVSFRAVKQLGQWALYAIVQDLLQENRVQVLNSDKNKTLTSNDLNARCLIVGCSYNF